jgi:50S ribosomal protein L16 3-hydroxylase
MSAIRWTPALLREFTGRFVSEPKPHVFFDAPRKPLTRTRFARQAARNGLALDPRARLVFSGTMFFLNGEVHEIPAKARAMLTRLADERRIAGPVRAPVEFWDVAHGWYLQGFAHAGEES